MRRPINQADFRAARRGAAILCAAFALYLAHVAHLDVRLGLGGGVIEGDAFLIEPAMPALRNRPILWITTENGRRVGFRRWEGDTWQRLRDAARHAGAKSKQGLGVRTWMTAPPATAPGDEREIRAWDRFVLRVRYAGLGRRVVTAIEPL